MDPAEQLISTLVTPTEYSHHIDEVAAVTTESLWVVQQKLLSVHGFEFVKYPLAECIRITSATRPATLKRATGILLLFLLLTFAAWVILHWDSYADARQMFQLFGLLLVPAALYLLLGPPKRVLVFELHGDKRLTWSSGYRDVTLKHKNIEGLLALAKKRRIDVQIQGSA